MDPNHHLINVVSWQIAVDLCRRDPRIRLYRTFPGGGQYDCLTLISESVNIDINRAGSIHVTSSAVPDQVQPIPRTRWTVAALDVGGAQRVAQQVAASAGIPWSTSPPATQPHTLGYRVIARALASRLFDAAAWDADVMLHDDSGPGGSYIQGTAPTADMASIPPNQLWRLTRNGDVVAWLWDGWCWTRAGDRIDLMSQRGQGATIDHLVAAATAAPSHRHSPPLPSTPDPRDHSAGDAS